jgi:hypothetical protein
MADHGNWHAANNRFELQGETYCIPAIDTIAASLLPLTAAWFPAISCLQWVPH